MKFPGLLLFTGLLSFNTQAQVSNEQINPSDEVRLFATRPDSATEVPPALRSELVAPFIIDGTVADPDTYNFHARLVVLPAPMFFRDICGGSIINSHFILTAAHCVQDHLTGAKQLDLKKSGVVVKNFSRGDVYRDEVKEIRAVHVYELFGIDAYYYGDIAILELAHPIVDNVRSMPIATMVDKASYDQQTTGVIIGMGDIDDQSSQPDTLLMSQANLRSQQQCERVLGQRNYPEVMCIQYGGRTCFGDSGGGLLYTNGQGRVQQIGITSYGYKRCELKEQYSVFTEIAYYESWINSIVTYGQALTFDPNGDHNGYHSYGDARGPVSSDGGDNGGAVAILTIILMLSCLACRQRPTH
ncbi:S1 family peptidase [Vibrio coralliilyticus]|nr:serine protease [Vibrio coralliilyticus]